MGRKAPWTSEEVENIKRWQTGPFHPLSCPDHSDMPLAITADALMCPKCDWRQTWVPTACTHAPVDLMGALAASFERTRPS